MTAPITICDDAGNECLTLSAECYKAQGLALGVFETSDFESQAYRRVLLTVLNDVQALFASLDALAADKANPDRLANYRTTRRTLETRLMYFNPAQQRNEADHRPQKETHAPRRFGAAVRAGTGRTVQDQRASASNG